jgi:hypothetical protein
MQTVLALEVISVIRVAHLKTASGSPRAKLKRSPYFKNTYKQALNSDDSIMVERFGGRVRLPSEKLFIAGVDNQDMPRVGSRYVLFLTNDFLGINHSDEDFNILMGYELKAGRVIPLDRTSPVFQD